MLESVENESRVQALGFKQVQEDELDQGRTSKRDGKSDGDQSNMANIDQVARPKKQASTRRNMPLSLGYPAVCIQNVYFSVDKSQQQSNFLNECLFRLGHCLNPLCARGQADSSRVQILRSVSLIVPQGTIFGLLGPSSCGKTTLLRCLVGLLKPDSGSIELFGQSSFRQAPSGSGRNGARSHVHDDHIGEPRQKGCTAPGSKVGYMPQDLGLYEDFTINQLLTMFGNYMRMDSDLIRARIKFMTKFLELPNANRVIQTLSGGQKRRVSFAIACLHMPPLIILDEPTVGVDPLLRRNIWKYLRRLATEENTTIIITTHYIEEAAQADQVALMRAGQILVQDSPKQIIKSNDSKTLEEAFLKICNNVQSVTTNKDKLKIVGQPRFNWPAEFEDLACGTEEKNEESAERVGESREESVIRELKLKAQEKLAIYDQLNCNRLQVEPIDERHVRRQASANLGENLCMTSGGMVESATSLKSELGNQIVGVTSFTRGDGLAPPSGTLKRNRLLKRNKFVLNNNLQDNDLLQNNALGLNKMSPTTRGQNRPLTDKLSCDDNWRKRISMNITLAMALLYKNYRRNVNSIPLLAFQFMLPMIQMISFSLCVGGRPTNIGLGIVNLDNPISFLAAPESLVTNNTDRFLMDVRDDSEDSLSLRYLSFIDRSMLSLKFYDDLDEAIHDVRRAKLWAVLVFGQNFTSSLAKRFDLDNFYQLDSDTIQSSVIKLYPDRSNKILDMICHRSLIDSYRAFLADEFEHLKRMPIEVAKPIFDIKPNVISNSIDGYTESIAPGLLASLTYIMAAGLTTFIMVVERSAGILERTYTCGISPVAYLLAHAIFRSFVMMLQIAFVLILTFYVLKQPLVGSIWLAYSMLMVLNMTGISYGLLVSSMVTDQNGAALTIVSSLVVKITLSGILWPFEAIPYWLRSICYIQPLTMPVQALKAITLKGATIGDRAVNLGFLVSISWLIVFLIISTKRFKFYQH